VADIRAWTVGCLGLVDSRPIVSGLDENEEELAELNAGIEVLLYGMVTWLSIITVASVSIFVAAWIHLNRVERYLDELEMRSSVSSESSRLVFIASASEVATLWCYIKV